MTSDRKPRLRRRHGWWWCGLPQLPHVWWSCGATPREAYQLWQRAQP